MCGVFAVVSSAPIADGVLEAAQAIQLHRGPDAQRIERLMVGNWHVGLAHQRLAILDLTVAGTQPMQSPSGRSLITYNGEIYNYLELRAELEGRGVVFRTHTDTEVIAAACEEFGIQEALTRLNGMWAFIWIDLANARIFVARDRFGVKPLYFWQRGGLFACASELKTLVRALQLRCAVNPRAVATFLRAQLQDVSDETFFEGILRLAPGHFAELRADGAAIRPVARCYWSLAAQEAAPPQEQAAIEQTRVLLSDAVRLRLRSDVPVGLLLSGGLDSSALAALASAQVGVDGNLTFISAVSDDPASDESAFIHTVARHLRRKVQEVRLEFPRKDVTSLIAKVTEECDEPISGFSCVAQNLLMERAREQGVTVLLSGQGADEVFCGYRKYAAFQMQALARSGDWLGAARLAGGFLRQNTLLNQFKVAEARRYLPGWLATRLPDVGGAALAGVATLGPPVGGRADVRDRQRSDIESLSIPALTHWEDRNSMAWSREVRNPFLDYRLVRFGVNLPMALKVRAGWTKFVLRHAMSDALPASIVWRRDKRGFTTPEAGIMRQELQSQVAELLSPSAEMVRRGLIEPKAAGERIRAFLNPSAWGRRVASRDVFALLSLELWLRAYRENLSG